MRHLVFILGLLSISTAALPAGFEFDLSGNARSRLEADDNRRLRVDSQEVSFATITNAQAKLDLRTETYSASLRPRVRTSRFTRETALNFDEYYVQLSMGKFWERARLSLDFDFERESSVTTELTDVGSAETNLPRTGLGLNLSWLYQVTPRFQTTLSGGLNQSTFESVPGSRFVDSDQANVGLDLDYQFSDRTALLFNSSASAFSTDNGRDTASYLYQAGLRSALTETFNATVLVGQNLSRITQELPQPVPATVQVLFFGTPFLVPNGNFVNKLRESSAGRVINVQVNKEIQRGFGTVAWSQFFSPTSQGVRARRESVVAGGEYDISLRWKAQLDYAFRNQTQEGRFGTLLASIETHSVRSQVSYQFAKEWFAEVGYRYLRQFNPATEDLTESNMLFIAVRYSGDPFFRIR